MSGNKKVIIVSLIAALLLFVTAFLAVPRLFDLERYKDQLTRLIASSTGKDVRIGKVGLSLWGGVNVYADDIVMSEGRAGEEREILRIGKISAGLKFFPLLKKKAVVRTIRIHSPEAPAAQDLYALPFLFLGSGGAAREQAAKLLQEKAAEEERGTSRAGLAIDLSHLREVSVKRGKVSVEKTLPSGRTIHLPLEDISLIVEGEEGSVSHSVSLDLSTGRNGGRIKARGILGKGDLKSGIPVDLESSLDIPNAGSFSEASQALFGLSIQGGGLELKSNITGMIGRELNITGQGKFTDLLLKAMPAGQNMASVKGRQPSVERESALAEKGKPSSGQEGIIRLDGDMTYSLTLQLAYLEIKDVKLSLGGSTITLTGGMDLGKKTPLLKFKIQGNDLSYDEIKSLSPLAGINFPDSLKGGHLDASLTGSLLLKDLTTKEFSGEAFLKEFRLEHSALSSPVEHLECRVRIYGDAVKIAEMKGEYQKEKIEGEIQIQNLKSPSASFRFGLYDGNIRGSLHSLGKRSMEGSGVGFPGGSAGESGSATGGSKGASRGYAFDSTISDIDTNSLVTALFPSNRDIIFGDLQGDARFQIGELSMEKWSSGLSGTLGLKILKGKITTFSILKEVGTLIKMAGGRGIGENETEFDLLEGNFNVSGEEARTNDLKFRSRDIDLDGGGALRFDSSIDFSLEAKFSSTASRDMVASTPMLKHRMGRDGRLSFPLRIKGTLAKPEVVLDMNRILKESSKEELFKSIKEYFRKRS